MRKSSNDCYTRGMVTGRRTLPISITIAARPRIKRDGPPTMGACFFDAEDRLIYIVANPGIRYFFWHRVMTDGTLSKQMYSGHWDWGQGARHRERGTP